jgi:hypothetical protein
MGYSISWIAFEGRTAPQAAEMLNLSCSGEFDEVPRSLFSGASFQTGWYVVVIDRFAHKFVSDGSLRRLSGSGRVIAARTEEHVMFSSAEEWSGGNRAWKVSHESEKGPRHLKEEGVFPEGYASIKQRLLAQQQREDDGAKEVDYVIEVPLQLAESIVGYKHDKALEARFEILKPGSGSSGGGLISRWLRRKP